MVTLDICVAKNTLSEVPGPDEDLPVDLEPWTEGSSSLTSTISLPAFGIRLEVFRTLPRLATLEELAPHLCVHRVQQHLSVLVQYLLLLLNHHQVGHNLLSGLEGPLVAIPIAAAQKIYFFLLLTIPKEYIYMLVTPLYIC